MEKSNCCKTCIFANHSYPLFSYEYECHRFPPTNAAGFNQVIQTVYPMVKGSDWCGEYKKEN